MSTSPPLRVGVIGCGGIAQMMHLPHLRELSELYELAAISDLSPGLNQVLGARYQIPSDACFTEYTTLLAQDVDAVLVLSGGNHYAPALAALNAGKHVFVEKPLCYSTREADELRDAATAANRTLMVGYMKRYDPGYLYAQARVREMQDLRYIQLNTLHPAEEDYVRHHGIVRFNDVPLEVFARLNEGEAPQIRHAVGDVSPALQRTYVGMFLSSMIHDTNVLRGLVGEPERVLFAELWATEKDGASLTTVLAYPNDLRVVYTWSYLGVLRDYFQELAVMSSASRLRIQFPSPYLKNFPTPVVFQGMENGAAFEKRVVVSYAEAFKQELIAFHDCVVNQQTPLTDVTDARNDIELLQKIFAVTHPAGLGGEAAAWSA